MTRRLTSLAILASAIALGRNAPPPRPKKTVLAWADTTTGYQHDSLSHALATIYRLGRESGAFETYIRTDSQWITKQPFPKGVGNAKDLDFFNAIVFLGTGDNLTGQQKQDLLSFVRDDGKGFVGVHSAVDAFYGWPEYAEMIGGWFDNHPWGQFDAPIVVEDPSFPAMRGFPSRFTLHDEIYELKNFSREKVHVLARLDSAELDYSVPDIRRRDHDFPVAWAKTYGKGRVFYSCFGHADETWDNPAVQKMYLEAIRWALRLTGDDVEIHPAK